MYPHLFSVQIIKAILEVKKKKKNFYIKSTSLLSLFNSIVFEFVKCAQCTDKHTFMPFLLKLLCHIYKYIVITHLLIRTFKIY